MKKNSRKIIKLFTVLLLVFAMTGCEAFVRKFTRKRKQEKIPQEQMVLSPIEYKANEAGKEELYRQNFLYWKSWHDELLTALSDNGNHKKEIQCLVEAVKSLEQIKTMLNEDSARKLAGYIEALNKIKNSIDKDPYGLNVRQIRLTAERIKSDILRDFSFKKIKDFLI